MHANKKVGPGVVGNGSALMKFNKYVRLACIDNLYVRKMVLDVFTKLQRNAQCHIFLFCFSTDTACVVPAMPGINTHPGKRIMLHRIVKRGTDKYGTEKYNPYEKFARK